MANHKGFVLPAKKRKPSNSIRGEVIRISTDAYNILVEMSNDSNLQMNRIASNAIEYAFENLVFEDEEREDEE